jgi:hypothetical protein
VYIYVCMYVCISLYASLRFPEEYRHFFGVCSVASDRFERSDNGVCILYLFGLLCFVSKYECACKCAQLTLLCLPQRRNSTIHIHTHTHIHTRQPKTYVPKRTRACKHSQAHKFIYPSNILHRNLVAHNLRNTHTHTYTRKSGTFCNYGFANFMQISCHMYTCMHACIHTYTYQKLHL